MGVAGVWNAHGDSLTADEIAHIPAAYAITALHDYRLNPEHPPLIKMLSGIPLYFLKPNFNNAWKEGKNSQSAVGEIMLWKSANNPDQILFWARLPIVILAAFFGLAVYKWATVVGGRAAGLVAITLYALSPNIIAHSHLVTTDFGLTAGTTLCLYFLLRCIHKPTWWRAVVVGAVYGLTLLTKFSAIELIPFFGLVLIYIVIAHVPFKLKIHKKILSTAQSIVLVITLILFTSLIVVWTGCMVASYRTPQAVVEQMINTAPFDDKGLGIFSKQHSQELLRKTATHTLTRPLALYTLGVTKVFARVKNGSTVFFLGTEHQHGLWYYYPLSFLIKTPLSVLILCLFSLVYCLYLWFHRAKNTPLQKTIMRFLDETIIIAALMWLIGVGISSNLNIGLRHLLPIYPLLFILLGVSSTRFFRLLLNRSGLWQRRMIFLLILALFIYQIITLITHLPHTLSYVNEAVGAHRAYAITVDSNLDWGQSLKYLVKFVNDRQIRHIKLDLFGVSPQEAQYYLGKKQETWRSKNGYTTGWLAISVTYYQSNSYYPSTSKSDATYDWLRAYRPVALIGGSILVFYIEPQSDTVDY